VAPVGKARAGRFAAVLSAAAIAICAVPVTAVASQTGSSDVSASVGGAGGVDLVGQTFTVPSAPATDTFFHRLDILKFSKASGTYKVYVTALDGGGLPTGSPLFTSPTLSAPFGPAQLRVYPNITVTPGTKYAFYTESTTGTLLGSSPPGSGPDVYAGGEWLEHDSGGWAKPPSIVNADIGFLADFNTGARDTLTTVSCAGPGKIGQPTACTATLKDAGAGTGLNGSQVALSTLSGTGSFSSSCFVNSSGSCAFNFTPAVSGSETIFGQYVGDNTTHLGSGANTGLSVSKRNSAQTGAGCTPATLQVGETATCFVTVSDTDSGTKTTPTGATSWSSTGAGAFADGGACGLTPDTLGVARCLSITYTPTAAGDHQITSVYAGDGTHLASSSASAGTLTVLAPTVPTPTVPGPDCSSVRAAISRLKARFRKAPRAKRAKLKKKLKRLRGQAAALGC
jgi:hypothetical protein